MNGNDPALPAIAFAAGRRTIPYLRALKRASPTTFTVFFGNPRVSRHGADVIWAPEHDGLSGPRVIVTATAPHTRSPEALAQARQAPHPAITVLPKPFVGMLLGGPSRHHRFASSDIDALIVTAREIRVQGFGLAVTGSRRTPTALIARLHDIFFDDPGAFVWSGEGQNPYVSILALAHALVVTADSTNMVGEALAVGTPVYLTEPSGGHPKLTAFRDGLLASEAVRMWNCDALRVARTSTPTPPLPHQGGGSSFVLSSDRTGLPQAALLRDPRAPSPLVGEGSRQVGIADLRRGGGAHQLSVPIDSTPLIAAEIIRRFAAFQQVVSQWTPLDSRV